MTPRRKFALAGTIAAALFATAAPAAYAITVQPVVIDLQPTGRSMSQVITVENTFTNPLTVEMRTEQLAFDENGAHGTGKDPGDLLIFPPQAIIQPGDTQTFRVQWVGDPDLKQSKHYYVTVAQLPVQLPAGQSAIQILYNFQVLVSVKPSGGKPDIKIVGSEIGHDAKGHPVPVLMVEDDSNTHGYLSQGKLHIVERDASGKEVFQRTLLGPEIQQTIGFGLIAPGQKRRVLVPVTLPSDGGKVEAQFTPDSRR
jgi:P pilus assembly chaperone PapD